MLRLFTWPIENLLTPSSLSTAEISPCTALGAIADSVSFPISPDSFGVGLQTPTRCRSAILSGIPKRRLQERRIHVAVADEADYAELDRYHDNGHQHGDPKIADQERQSVSDSAG